MTAENFRKPRLRTAQACSRNIYRLGKQMSAEMSIAAGDFHRCNPQLVLEGECSHDDAVNHRAHKIATIIRYSMSAPAPGWRN